MRFSIFTRSAAGYLIALFLLGASNVYAILQLVQFNAVTLKSLEVDIRLLDTKEKLVDSLFSQRRYDQKYIITKDETLYQQFLTASQDYQKYFDELEPSAYSPVQRNNIENIQNNYQHYRSLFDAEVNYLQTGKPYNQLKYRRDKEKVTDAMLTAFTDLETNARKDVYNKTKKVKEAGLTAQSVAIISFLITALLAVLLSFFITRSITKPLIKLVHKTREIPAGHFYCEFSLSAPPEVRELADAFQVMCERLKEVDQLKANFFSMISHELRTPLTTIQEGSSLLLEGVGGQITEKQNKLLSIITAESNRLIGLVNSILDLSKMEAGMVPYTFDRSNLASLIEQATAEIIPYAEAKKITLEKRISKDMPLCRIDKERILEALRNLIANAVKFTPEGGVITIAAQPRKEGMEVSVEDTGPGIPKDNLLNIFDKFASSDKRKGTGLGLAIVKQIITAHGGKVWAESEMGQGTRFIFIVPF